MPTTEERTDLLQVQKKTRCNCIVDISKLAITRVGKLSSKAVILLLIAAIKCSNFG